MSEALARVDAQRERLAGQLNELEATERVLARYSKGGSEQKDEFGQGVQHGKRGRCSSVPRSTAQGGGKAECWPGRLAEPRRSDPCPGKRQNAAGNRRGMRRGTR